MNAYASLDAVTVPPATAPLKPIVLIDGVPELRLNVTEWQAQGPTDRRQAELAIITDASTDIDLLIEQWRDAEATLAIPLRLTDEQVRYTILAHGKLAHVDVDRSAQRDDVRLELRDHWNIHLDNELSTAWFQSGDSLLNQPIGPASLQIGSSANRSLQTWPIGTHTVHVLQQRGQAWTVATALATLSAFAKLDLAVDLLPRELQDAPLLTPINLRQPIGAALERIMTPYGLVIQRDLSRRGGSVAEYRAVRRGNQGRKVRLAWASNNRPLGQVLKIDAGRPVDAAQPWIARASGWQVESTFELKQGWDPALEGEVDATYSRLNNADFATYANVFRLWVLNEDGRFTDAPFSQGPAFDLTNLFDSATVVPPQPLRFLSALTLDDAGLRRRPIIEMSTDSGTSWLTYPGPTRLITDQAAVYLNDETLPSAFLAAAAAGTALIRVTASLQSPLPVEILRWRGNPFTGILPPKVFDVRDAFSFQRVDSASIHFTDVQTGSLSALNNDDTNALNDWLIARMEQEDRAPRERVGRATLELAGAWANLRVADHLRDTASDGINSAGRAEAIAQKGATVQSVRCRWSKAKATTTVELSF